MIKFEYRCDNCGECKPYLPSKSSYVVCYKCNHDERIPTPKPIDEEEYKEYKENKKLSES